MKRHFDPTTANDKESDYSYKLLIVLFDSRFSIAGIARKMLNLSKHGQQYTFKGREANS